MANDYFSIFNRHTLLLSKKIKECVKYMESFKVVSLKPKQPWQGNLLISYCIEPFFLKPGKPFPNDYTWYWEYQQIAQTFLELGYCIDLIQFQNYKFIPQKEYTFFIDICHRMESLSPLLNQDCIKILHSNTAHVLFHNAAESRRLLALQQRKRITLGAKRLEAPNLSIEHADCAIVLGNEFTINTFRYAKKPIYRVPLSSPQVYPWPEEKDFGVCRKSFLWFGSDGLVHQGLDLVLEAFEQMPNYHLTVCGPISKERDFEKAFYKELYYTSNIHTIEWVDIKSSKFLEITKNCVGIIYPSCAEGGGGCVITCMHAGLIPIVSYESSVDVYNDFGVLLKESSVEEIKDSIQIVASFSTSKLKKMARKSWEYARNHHTHKNFTELYKDTINKIINNHYNQNLVVSTKSN